MSAENLTTMYEFKNKIYNRRVSGSLAALLSELEEAGIIQRIIRETESGFTLVYFDKDDMYLGTSKVIDKVLGKLSKYVKLINEA